MDRRSFIGQLIKGAIGAAILPSIVAEASEPIGQGLLWQIEQCKNYTVYAPLTEEKLLDLVEGMMYKDGDEIGFNI